MIDPLWAGAAGGAVAGASTCLATYLTARSARLTRKEELRAAAESAESGAKRAYRQQLVKQWREGLAGSAKADENWERERTIRGDSDEPIPDLVGLEWFESLRPHLDRTNAENADLLRQSVYYSSSKALVISDEIARVEKVWDLT